LQAAEALFTQIYHDIYFGTNFPFGFAEAGLALLQQPYPIAANFLLVLLPIPVSSITCYYLVLRRIRGDRIFAAVAGISYAINPLTVSRIYTVEVLMLWVYALIPLFFMLALEYKNPRSALASAIVLNLMLALRPQTLYIVGFIGLGLLLANLFPIDKIWMIIKRDSNIILKTAIYFVLTTIAFNGVYLGKIILSSTANPTSTAEVTYLYSNASPESIFRLVGEPSFYHSLFGYYDLTNPLTILGIISLLAFLAISLSSIGRDPKIRAWALVFVFIFILLSIGHFVGVSWDQLIASTTITSGLRNPNKFLFAMALPFSILIANGFDTLRGTLSSTRRRPTLPSRLYSLRRTLSSARQKIRLRSFPAGTISVAIVIALILLQNYPLVTADLLSQENQLSLRNSYWADPGSWSRYNQLSQYLSNYRTLILPFTYEVESAADSWLAGYQIVSVPPAETGAETGALTYWSILLDSIANDQSDIAYNLKVGGIRYVIVDQNQSSTLNRLVALEANNLNDLTQPKGRIDNYLYMEPDEIVKILSSQPSMRYLGDYSGLRLFENIEYSGRLFGAYLAYTADPTIATNIPLLSNDAIPTSDPTLAKYATATVFNATHPFDTSTIQLDTPQILIYPAASTSSRIWPTEISGNLAMANISIAYNSAQPGWKNVEIVSPYPLAVQPSGINNYNLLYATGAGWVPTWNASGFNDIFVDNQTIPIAVYKANISGAGGLESYSAPLLSQPPQSFNYSSLPGIHKGFTFYTGTRPVALTLSFRLVLDRESFVYNMISYQASLSQNSSFRILITPVDHCEISSGTLQTQNFAYVGVVDYHGISFQNVTMTPTDTSFIVSGEGISSCSDAVAWLIPGRIYSGLQQTVPVPSSITETPGSLKASLTYNGPEVLVLTYAYDPSWTLAAAGTTAHFNAFGMNGFLLEAPASALDFVYAGANSSIQLFAASGVAAALLVAFFFLTERADLLQVKRSPLQRKPMIP